MQAALNVYEMDSRLQKAGNVKMIEFPCNSPFGDGLILAFFIADVAAKSFDLWDFIFSLGHGRASQHVFTINFRLVHQTVICVMSIYFIGIWFFRYKHHPFSSFRTIFQDGYGTFFVRQWALLLSGVGLAFMFFWRSPYVAAELIFWGES